MLLWPRKPASMLLPSRWRSHARCAWICAVTCSNQPCRLRSCRPPAQAIVRKQFSGKAFETAELQTAIDDARSLVSELTAGLVVQGPGRIHSMFDSNDKLQAAMDDILGAPRDPGKEKLQIHRPTGIRELYLMLTGDWDLHGGYYGERIQLATTADFTGLVKNALNKIVAQQWEALGKAGYDWWEKIVKIEHFTSLNSITGTLIGTVGALPTVAEGAEYTELAIGDSPETASFTKSGGCITHSPWSWSTGTKLRKLKAYASRAWLHCPPQDQRVGFPGSSWPIQTLALPWPMAAHCSTIRPSPPSRAIRTCSPRPWLPAEWDVVCKAVFDQPMLIKNATGYYGTSPKWASTRAIGSSPAPSSSPP